MITSSTPTSSVLCAPSNSDRQLPELSSRFYTEAGREIIPLCGYEFGTPDFYSALESVNKRLNLQLDDLDRRTLGVLLTCLSQAQRFGGEMHISPIMGENSAAHSLHSMVLGTELFRRAGLVSLQSQDAAVTEMRGKIALGLLVHDMGEILGELSSVASRAANEAVRERPDIEREIFRIALTEAFRATAATTPDIGGFYSFIRDKRQEAGIGPGKSNEEILASLEVLISQYNREYAHLPLSPEVQQRVDRYLALYDVAELKPHAAHRSDRFVGNAVKVIEHLQGLRHMTRFAARTPLDVRRNILFPDSAPSSPQGHWVKPNTKEAIPLRYATNHRMNKNLWYIEKDLAHLSNTAEAPHELTLAATLREATYISQAEWLGLMRPIFDRRVQGEDEFFLELRKEYDAETSEERSAYILSTIQKYLAHLLRVDTREYEANRRASGPAPETALEPIESRERMVALYLHAARTGYIPTVETPLVLLNDLPDQLHGFESASTQSLHTPSVASTFAELRLPAAGEV
jgi:hypothetical protein